MRKTIALFLIHCLLGIAIVNANENDHAIYFADSPIKILIKKDNIKIEMEQNDMDTIRIPLIRAGNLFLIEAKIDNMIGHFVIDLGAPYLVLNSTYFRDYIIDQDYFSGTLFSENDFVKRTKVKKLNIQSLNYLNISADLTDLGAIENQREIKILGLLGVALFNNYVFDLNLADKQLLLYKKLDKNTIKTALIFEIPFRLSNNVILINAKSKDFELTFSLDSGAERNVLDNSLPKSVYEGMKILKTVNITDGNGANTEALLAFLNTISINGQNLGKMPTLIVNLGTMSRAYQNDIDGMLGYPFFSLGRVILDFNKKQLLLYSNNRNEE